MMSGLLCHTVEGISFQPVFMTKASAIFRQEESAYFCDVIPPGNLGLIAFLGSREAFIKRVRILYDQHRNVIGVFFEDTDTRKIES